MTLPPAYGDGFAGIANILGGGGILYLQGSEFVDDSVRLIVGPSGQAQVQRRKSGVWNLSELELSRGSLLLGRETTLSAIGHHLASEGADVGERILIGGSHFDDSGTEQTHGVNLAARINRLIVQADESLDVTLSDHLSLIGVPFVGIFHKLYIKVGATGASADVRVEFSRVSTSTVFFARNYPASTFLANTEIALEIIPAVEFPPDPQFNVRVTSDNSLGLLHEATGNFIWVAMDVQEQSIDFVLTETLVLSNDLSLTFSNAGELVQGNVF